jgi:hypothetical protein
MYSEWLLAEECDQTMQGQQKSPMGSCYNRRSRPWKQISPDMLIKGFENYHTSDMDGREDRKEV